MHLRVSMTIGSIKSRFKIAPFKMRRGLLPALCVAAALAAAIVTVRAADHVAAQQDDPGSSAANMTGMGNSFEYPNSNQDQTKASPKPESKPESKTGSEQRAGAVAPTDSNPKINTDTSKKESGSCTAAGPASNCSASKSGGPPSKSDGKSSGDREVLD